MSARLQPDELAFFAALASAGSLTAAARELNVSTAAVSKRLSAMEKRLGVGPRAPHDAPHEPDAGGRTVPAARAPHPRRPARHGTGGQRLARHAARPAARQRDAGLRPQPRGAGALALRAQVPAGRSAAAAVRESAAAHRRRVRRLHPLRRAARRARRRAPHRRQPAAPRRGARVPRARRHAAGAAGPHAPQLHRHPPGRRSLRAVAPDRHACRRPQDGRDPDARHARRPTTARSP